MNTQPGRHRILYAVIFLLPAAGLLWADRPTWISLALFLNLYALALYDQFTFRLPNLLTGTLVLLGLLRAYLDGLALQPYLIGVAAGFLSLWLLAFLYEKLRGRRGMGMGDAKFLAGAGAWVAWYGLPFVLLAASLAGLGAFVLKTVMKGKFDPLEPIPFGPYLCLGAWLSWLYFDLIS
ncbi:prepilin peptidase [Kordiimonas aestuarii]|uniref:prepilin peptidase n=1 Tax=Kordiimonas aestuarii TaxID=1005925 RepID=UPI0021D16000|nr:A24 family peptidase [Kordiimonas aestuarii]